MLVFQKKQKDVTREVNVQSIKHFSIGKLIAYFFNDLFSPTNALALLIYVDLENKFNASLSVIFVFTDIAKCQFAEERGFHFTLGKLTSNQISGYLNTYQIHMWTHILKFISAQQLDLTFRRIENFLFFPKNLFDLYGCCQTDIYEHYDNETTFQWFDKTFRHFLGLQSIGPQFTGLLKDLQFAITMPLNLFCVFEMARLFQNLFQCGHSINAICKLFHQV